MSVYELPTKSWISIDYYFWYRERNRVEIVLKKIAFSNKIIKIYGDLSQGRIWVAVKRFQRIMD